MCLRSTKQTTFIMRLRFWVLVLADVMVIIHIIYLVLLVINQQKTSFTWMFSGKVHLPLYIVTNIMPIVISSFLYVGIFRLSTRLLFMWLTAMVLLWHIPAILIFFILCLDREDGPNASKQRILAPSLWLCVWMLLIINVFTLYSELKKFKKHPQFLRTDVILVKKITNLSKLKKGQPGNLLVPVDSEM